MRTVLVAGCFALGCSSPNKPPSTAPEPTLTTAAPPVDRPGGLVPPQPTLRLPRNFLPTAYDLKLDIDPSKAKFQGVAAITGKVSEKSSVIWLHGFHLETNGAVAKGAAGEIPLEVTPKGEDLLELRAQQPLDAGVWTIQIAYTAELDPVNTTGAFKQTVTGKTYVFTQLEALFARRVFPSFDEPNIKVPFTLALRVPKALVAVANTPMTKETADGNMKVVEFAPTKPLPTYLVAFGIGPFEVIDAGKSKRGTPVRIVTLAGRGADAAYAVQTTARILDATEDYFGIPYPYEKLDMLTIPLTVGFSAMENAGLITTTEADMLMDPKQPSQARKLDWFGTAAHEIAHQWFGNYVTPEFWDDIWLNEGFATWLGSKITAKLEPAWRGDQQLVSLVHAALDADSIVSARKIRQPIESVGDIHTAFDGITYLKGASVLRMIESYVGEDVFQRGIREYMAGRAWGNATSADFVASINKASVGKPVDAAFASFLDRGGAPEIAMTTSCRGGKVELQLSQRRYLPPGAPEPAASTPWIIPVCVAYDKAGKRAEQCTMFDKQSAVVALDTKTCPRWVMPNVDGRGYYRNVYTTQQVIALRDEAWSKLSWVERRALHFDMSNAATTGKLPLALALSFTPKMLAGSDGLAVSAALELPNGFAQIVPDDLRGKYEVWLRQQFAAAANAIGFTPKDTDTLDVETMRLDLVRTVAWTAREPALVAEAVKLADRWRELPEAIRGTVLQIAVETRPEVFEKTLREIAAEPDRQRRKEMFLALGGVRDPARFKTALALVLDAKIDVREATRLVFMAKTEATRETAKQFVRDNLAAILARMPTAQTTNPIAGLSYVFTASCRADQRDAIADYVTKTFGSMQGGDRVVKQAIEGMDQCIARRKLLDPEIKAWLGGLRVPKK
ncbi:MAG: ERAP1-like C-terminal domain-containing protein [Myxococcota bacterium]|nr:ERAP1-like C-terminal domain-containing protein [Deltaproteobacteria bacterium]MDQ3335903.1 ERAP1-like C-terminal domain-containing protein [Myxococcota bacterium]